MRGVQSLFFTPCVFPDALFKNMVIQKNMQIYIYSYVNIHFYDKKRRAVCTLRFDRYSFSTRSLIVRQ